jgi:sugar phosphate permease
MMIKDASSMTIPDITLAVFTIFNSLRFLAYVPQIAKSLKDRSGAEAFSFGTWALFLASHASAMAYAIENQRDWKMAFLFLSNCLGCGAVLLIAAWKRSRHRKRRTRLSKLLRRNPATDASHAGERITLAPMRQREC